jgi:hypothetical protein
LIYGVQLFFAAQPRPMPYTVSTLIIAGLELALPWFVLRRSRPAWSFLLSLNGTLAVVTLFGATRMRDTYEVSIGIALLPAVVFALICTFAAMAHEDF